MIIPLFPHLPLEGPCLPKLTLFLIRPWYVRGIAQYAASMPCMCNAVMVNLSCVRMDFPKLMADGTLLASPWAINSHGKPLHPAWILGNLAQEPLSKILASEYTQKLISRLDENYGYCKIFSFLNSKLDDPLDRIFDQADPLYSEVEIHHPSTMPGYISKQSVDI